MLSVKIFYLFLYFLFLWIIFLYIYFVFYLNTLTRITKRIYLYRHCIFLGVELQKLFQHALPNKLMPEIRTISSPPLSPIPASPNSCFFSQLQKHQSDSSLTSKNISENISAILDRDLSLSDSDSETFESFSNINTQSKNPFLVKSDVKKMNEIVSMNIIEINTYDDESTDFSLKNVQTNTDTIVNTDSIVNTDTIVNTDSIEADGNEIDFHVNKSIETDAIEADGDDFPVARNETNASMIITDQKADFDFKDEVESMICPGVKVDDNMDKYIDMDKNEISMNVVKKNIDVSADVKKLSCDNCINFVTSIVACDDKVGVSIDLSVSNPVDDVGVCDKISVENFSTINKSVVAVKVEDQSNEDSFGDKNDVFLSVGKNDFIEDPDNKECVCVDAKKENTFSKTIFYPNVTNNVTSHQTTLNVKKKEKENQIKKNLKENNKLFIVNQDIQSEALVDVLNVAKVSSNVKSFVNNVAREKMEKRNPELIRKKIKTKLKKNINSSEFISSSESEEEGSSKLLKCNQTSSQFAAGCTDIKSEIKNKKKANVESNLKSVSFGSLPVLNKKFLKFSKSKSIKQLSEHNTYSLLQDGNDHKEDVGRILSVSSFSMNEQVFEQSLTNYTSQIESIPITRQHSVFTCVPSFQCTTTVTTCNVQQSSLTYPNIFRPLSPPLSPIPPSPGRPLLTPIISPLPQNDCSQSTTLISNQVSSSRHSHLTPIISPLPQTPLPESVSPLPLSPTILSPPLIRGSALLQAENSSIFAPKPVTQRLVTDEISMKYIDTNVEQPELSCSMMIRGLECNYLGKNFKKRTSDLLNKNESKLIVSSQDNDQIDSVYSKQSLLKQGPFAAKRSLLLNESFDPVTKTTDKKSFNKKKSTSSIKLVTKAFQATSRNVESSLTVSVDENISIKNLRKIDLNTNFVDTKVPLIDNSSLKTFATLTTFEKKGNLKRKPSLISPNDASLFKKPKINEVISNFNTSCTDVASYKQKCDQNSNTTDFISACPKLVDVSKNSHQGIQEDFSNINCNASSKLSFNLCTQISSSVKNLEMKKGKANSSKDDDRNMVRISVLNDLGENKPHEEGEVFDAEDITSCDCIPVGLIKDKVINSPPCSEELKYRKRDSKQTEVGYVLQLLQKFSKKSINKQRLINALSDKMNTSAASLSRAIVKHVASCEVFLLPTMLKLLQKTICTECVKSRFLNITQSCCKLCTKPMLSNVSFFETCHPISLLTPQVLTETENNLLCVLNDLIKLPHLKKLFQLLTQHSRSAVLDGKGEMLSCEILAVWYVLCFVLFIGFLLVNIYIIFIILNNYFVNIYIIIFNNI